MRALAVPAAPAKASRSWPPLRVPQHETDVVVCTGIWFLAYAWFHEIGFL